MALELSARSPVVRPRALDGGPRCTGASQQVVPLGAFFLSASPHVFSPSLQKMKFDWRENFFFSFSSSLCCHLADRLRAMSGRPDACIVLRLLLFQTPVGKCMT